MGNVGVYVVSSKGENLAVDIVDRPGGWHNLKLPGDRCIVFLDHPADIPLLHQADQAGALKNAEVVRDVGGVNMQTLRGLRDGERLARQKTEYFHPHGMKIRTSLLRRRELESRRSG